MQVRIDFEIVDSTVNFYFVRNKTLNINHADIISEIFGSLMDLMNYKTSDSLLIDYLSDKYEIVTKILADLMFVTSFNDRQCKLAQALEEVNSAKQLIKKIKELK